MSDWQVGDLAVCEVGAERWFGYVNYSLPTSAPLKNGVYRVVGLKQRDGLEFLHFTDFGGKGWNASAFRKIRPDQHEACETAFVTLLKRSKQRVSA